MYTLLALDLRRAFYLVGVALRFGAPPLFRRILGLEVDRADAGRRLRSALETLGLTYVKLGQYLASRLDLLPEEVCRELTQLFERARPVSFEQIRAVVEADLGQPLARLFTDFGRQPIAAASVAQVHEARTLEGDHVAVKVQRPNVARLFGADMRNLHRLAVMVDATGMLGTISMRQVLSEFEKWTRRELDFTTEGRTADRLRREATPSGAVPRIYWDRTAPRVLTMEFVEGLSLARVFELLEAGREREMAAMYPRMDLHRIAANLIEIVMNQLFVTGFFHGDPHPGNIFVRPDNTIVLLDCGIFGELPDQQREYLAAHIENLAMGDIDSAYYYYAKQLTMTDETDRSEFEREAKGLLSAWLRNASSPHTRYEERQIGKYGGEMLMLVRRSHIRMTTDTLLFWRALEALDATAIRFRSHFDLLQAMRAFFERIRPSPAERAARVLGDRTIWAHAARVAGLAPNAAFEAISRLGVGRPAKVGRGEARLGRRSRNYEAKGIAVAALSVGAIVVAAAVTGYAGPLLLRAMSGIAALFLAALTVAFVKRQ